ncbi:MAG: DUF3344 domain-containing protein [Euryarchaeota archaeon]|nr:DUF3344 domain-containing protein [Euryarchaeota archaeon]
MEKWKSSVVIVAIALLAVVALMGGAAAQQPDLNVTSITINPGDTRGDIVRVYINESNNVTAVVSNEGDQAAGAFDVCFAVRNSATTYKIGCVAVAELAAGENTTVYTYWTPTCENFPSVMSEFPYTSEAFWINVTADCNCTDCPTCPDDGSNGKIAESNETNNMISKFIPAIQVYSGYDVIGGVVNNGYKSKNFDCNTTEEPLTLFEYDSEIVGGGIAYNVSGVKITLKPTNTSTRVHHIDILSSATVKKARLYVYWYDKWGNYETYPSGCLANLSVNFSGTAIMPAMKYSDSKSFGKYQSPKGTYAYNVTSLVTGSGDYDVVVKNLDPNNGTMVLGELLYVVYEIPDHSKKMQLWTMEGSDYLLASHGSYQYCVSPEEATATVTFPGAIDLANVTSATLVSVVAQGRTTGMDMLFNDSIVKTDAWDRDTEAYPESKICVESMDVAAYLAASGNNIGFRDNGTNGMQASNTFLVITYGEEEEEIFDTHAPANPYPSIMGIHEGKIIPSCNITVSKLYTYPCTGTGGHTKSIELFENDDLIVNGTWSGYMGDYHNISLNRTLTLKKGVIYNYTIKTGSYPQIIHEHEYKNATGGTITCTKFVDANGKEHNDWIPAIRLWG